MDHTTQSRAAYLASRLREQFGLTNDDATRAAATAVRVLDPFPHAAAAADAGLLMDAQKRYLLAASGTITVDDAANLEDGEIGRIFRERYSGPGGRP